MLKRIRFWLQLKGIVFDTCTREEAIQAFMGDKIIYKVTTKIVEKVTVETV